VKGQDPLALAIFGAALALLAGLVLYVLFGKSPESAPRGPGLSEKARQIVESLRTTEAPKPAAKTVPAPAGAPPRAAASAPKAAPTPAPTAAKVALPLGHSWRYAVVVQPPVWRDITLTYRSQSEGGGTGVLTDFLHAGGKMNFHLGTYAPGHASHANTRFPGFFMYASYFPASLQPGQSLSWSWAWQPLREGRIKRFEARALRWENVQVPAGTFRALLIETELSYVEGGQVRGRAKESLWYSPNVSQLVKVVREGRTPDENLERIVAELAEYR
jgi:hypothetical protein